MTPKNLEPHVEVKGGRLMVVPKWGACGSPANGGVAVGAVGAEEFRENL